MAPVAARDEAELTGVIERTADMSRTHRERLLKNGFIREVIKVAGTFPRGPMKSWGRVPRGTRPSGAIRQPAHGKLMGRDA